MEQLYNAPKFCNPLKNNLMIFILNFHWLAENTYGGTLILLGKKAMSSFLYHVLGVGGYISLY